MSKPKFRVSNLVRYNGKPYRVFNITLTDGLYHYLLMGQDDKLLDEWVSENSLKRVPKVVGVNGVLSFTLIGFMGLWLALLKGCIRG